jgi:Uma2 family endonuclease
MVLDIQKRSVTEFDKWVHQPENIEHNYEYIRGDIIEGGSNSKSSKIGSIFGGFIAVHVHNNNLGHTTGADGGYQIGDERYIPNVGIISQARMSEFEDASYLSISPDLAVEVVSPTDSQRLITVKVVNYLVAGTTDWVVYPEEKEVEIYAPNTAVIKLTEDDDLDGDDLLPNFQLSLKDLFK